MGLGQSIGPAFADFAPGLAPFDWLIGIVGAVGFRLLIYFKSKKAKKFRRDAEYGTARFGTKEDIKPFVDPKFQNNVILTGTEFLTMNTRPKIPANARNLNACVIGSSGSGKDKVLADPAAPSSPFLVCGGRPEGRHPRPVRAVSATGEIQGAGVQQYRLFKIHALQSAGLYPRRKAMF